MTPAPRLLWLWPTIALLAVLGAGIAWGPSIVPGSMRHENCERCGMNRIVHRRWMHEAADPWLETPVSRWTGSISGPCAGHQPFATASRSWDWFGRGGDIVCGSWSAIGAIHLLAEVDDAAAREALAGYRAFLRLDPARNDGRWRDRAERFRGAARTMLDQKAPSLPGP